MCAAFLAGIAQLVEQLICNQQVVGSNPTAGFLLKFPRLNFAGTRKDAEFARGFKEIAFFPVSRNVTLTI
jgi:hypothetical protein